MPPTSTLWDQLAWVITSWEGIAGVVAAMLGLGTTAGVYARRHLSSVSAGFAELRTIGQEFRKNSGSTLRDVIEDISVNIGKLHSHVSNLEASMVSQLEITRVICGELNVALFRSDTHGNCQWVSSSWCELSGMSFAEAVGQGWRGAIDPRDRDRVDAEWDRCTEEACFFRSDFRFLRPDGFSVWVNCRASATKAHDGKVACMVATYKALQRPLEQFVQPS